MGLAPTLASLILSTPQQHPDPGWECSAGFCLVLWLPLLVLWGHCPFSANASPTSSCLPSEQGW